MFAKVGRGFAIGAMALLLAGCVGPGPTVEPSSVATPVPTASPGGMPTTSPVPSPTAAPATVDAAAWYPISIFPDEPALGTATMTAVTSTWFGFLAVGWTPSGGTSWWSGDGRDWTAALYQDRNLRNAMLTGVAASTTRIVAIGEAEAIDGQTHARIWTSADGLAWTTTFKEPADSFITFDSIVRTATAFVVVGTIDDGNGRVAMWTSLDGAAWTETDLPGGAPMQIVDGPAGQLVLEDTGTADVEGRSASLIGPSGVVVAALPPGLIETVASAPDAYWAFAEPATSTGPGIPVYRSVDGLTWTRTGALPTTSAIAAAVAQVNGSLAVVTSSGEPRRTPELFHSADGSRWDPVTWPSALEKGADITALAVGLDGIVGVGSIGWRRPAAWIGLPLTADPPGPLARDPLPTGCPSRRTWSGTPLAVLDAVLRLTDAQRVRCLGTTTIRVAGFLAEPDGLGGFCAATATPDWLTGGCGEYPSGWLEDVAAPFGRADTLDLFDRPALPRTLKVPRWIVATGHFDDPLSSTCREVGLDGKRDEPLVESVSRCRAHFAVSSIAAYPAPPASPIDPAAALGLPATDLLAPAFSGWDDLVLPTGTTYGFREVTPADGAGVVVTVFRAVDPASGAAAARSIISAVGPTTLTAVLGVSVSVTGDGTQAVFSVGSRVFQLQLDGIDAPPTTSQAASLQHVLEDCIRAATAT